MIHLISSRPQYNLEGLSTLVNDLSSLTYVIYPKFALQNASLDLSTATNVFLLNQHYKFWKARNWVKGFYTNKLPPLELVSLD
jgi:hypothetical protein